ncbi:MAG TPA: recombinase family protein [Roseomonas sp.]|nr:recombinase family protein [Roseomonas sp.]
MARVGHARVSTEEQATARQRDELHAAGCRTVAEEHASGGDRDRPVLAQLRSGDTLAVVEGLRARGVHFRSLRDPVDTASPQGLFTLQVLGAAAQLERALIRERTRSGMRAAAARGSRPGNPGLRVGDPAARQAVAAARRASYLARLVTTADAWLPAVRRLRQGGRSWEDVVRHLNARRAAGLPGWTGQRLARAVRRLVAEGLVERTSPAGPGARPAALRPRGDAARDRRAAGGDPRADAPGRHHLATGLGRACRRPRLEGRPVPAPYSDPPPGPAGGSPLSSRARRRANPGKRTRFDAAALLMDYVW